MSARRRAVSKLAKLKAQLAEAALGLAIKLMQPGALIPLATAIGLGVQGNMKANKTEDNVHDITAVVAKMDSAIAQGYGWNRRQDARMDSIVVAISRSDVRQRRLKAVVDTVAAEPAPGILQRSFGWIPGLFGGRGKGG